MPWEERPEAHARHTDVAELVFRIRAPSLPVAHAVPLYHALVKRLPWLADDPLAGIHEIHGAASGNGWLRPEAGHGGDDILHLSRRARLVLRLGTAARTSALSLSGALLDIGGHTLEVGAARERPLQPLSTQFARCVQCHADESEATFEASLVAELAGHGIQVRKLVCGRQRSIATPTGVLRGHSVMLAALAPDEAIRLQEQPLRGPGVLGLGLFLPHKGVEAIRAASDGA